MAQSLRSLIRTIVVLCILAATSLSGKVVEAGVNDYCYQEIKKIEKSLQWPAQNADFQETLSFNKDYFSGKDFTGFYLVLKPKPLPGGPAFQMDYAWGTVVGPNNETMYHKTVQCDAFNATLHVRVVVSGSTSLSATVAVKIVDDPSQPITKTFSSAGYTANPSNGQLETTVDVPVNVACKLEILTTVVAPPIYSASAPGKVWQPVEIPRPNVLAAGVYTVPALVTTLVYEPPQTSEGKNECSLACNAVLSNALTSMTSTSTSKSAPVASRYEDHMAIASYCAKAGAALASVPNPYAVAAGVVLSGISRLMGGASSTEINSYSEERSNTLILRTGLGSNLNTGLHLGPGPGDTIEFIKGAKLAWFGKVENGKLLITIALIGWDAPPKKCTAKELIDDLEGQRSGAAPKIYKTLLSGGVYSSFTLDKSTLEYILSPDPFVNTRASYRNLTTGKTSIVTQTRDNPDLGRFPERFLYLRDIDESRMLGSPSDSYQLTAEEMKIGTVGKTTSTTRIDDLTKSTLSFLGLGPSETSSTEVRHSQSTASTVTSSTGCSATLTEYVDPQGPYCLKLYRDLVYGALAVVRPSVASKPFIPGVSVPPNTVVRLDIGGMRIYTRSGPTGQIKIWTANLPTGTATLRYGGTTRTVTIPKLP